MHEVVDYVYLSQARQPYEYNCYYINRQAWAELPDDLKKMLDGADPEMLKKIKDMLKDQ